MKLNINSTLCKSYLRNMFPFSSGKRFYSGKLAKLIGSEDRYWAYRYAAQQYLPNDLCTFVRNHLLLIFRNIVSAVILSTAAMSVIATIYMFFNPDAFCGNEWFILFGIAVITVTTATSLILGGVFTLYCIHKNKPNKNKPSIITEYYMGLKNKYCPYISYTATDEQHAEDVEEKIKNVIAESIPVDKLKDKSKPKNKNKSKTRKAKKNG